MYLFVFFVIVGLMWWGTSLSSIFDFYLDRCGFIAGEGILMFDSVSFLCVVMLFFCGSVALFFCGHYFSGLIEGYLLGCLLFFFLMVMGGLVLSYNLLGTLVMWEYLGIVSFFLILFYGNLDSLRAALITVFASRFGDVCLFGLIVFITCCWGSSYLLFSFLLLLVVLTKSACFPFISWLLEAMRAPTPVSSLVHSSTLVAAGVWFLFRYGNSVFALSSGLEMFFFFLSLSTILISSFCSMVFLDLKKIIALSTCNNISWCIVFFLFGDTLLGLFQLLSHGVAKCYLFISLGDLMGGSFASQDSRGVYCSGYSGLLSLGVQTILVLSLCGMPFIGIFFSKHGLLCEVVWAVSPLSYIFLFFAFMLSYAYSFRLLGLLYGFSSFGVSAHSCLFMLILFLSLLSGGLNMLFLFGSEELYSVGFLSSLVFIAFFLLGCIVGIFLCFSPFNSRFSLSGFFIWGCDALVEAFYYVFSYFYRILLFFLYRWEVSGLSYFSVVVNSGGLFMGWNSLKFLVFIGFCVLCGCFILV